MFIVYIVCQDVLLFVDKPNSRLYCLLCKKVFKEPVIVSCGVCITRSLLYIRHI